VFSSLTIGTRGSKLALAQSNQVADRLRRLAPSMRVNVVIIRTTGDRILDAPLAQIGGKGLFTKELEVALLDRTIDLAIHSMKDLPTELPPGLIVGAIPKRARPFDALVCEKFESLVKLPAGAKVGTSSLRRAAQLRVLRNDLEIVDLRGNIDTRIEKVRNGDLEAAVLACAGLERLGLADVIREAISEDIMLPAVGQGALAIEIRAEDTRLKDFLGEIADPVSTLEVEAERAVLGALGGGCQVPIGALARAHGDQLHVTACVCSLDGQTIIRSSRTGPMVAAAETGRALAAELVDRGAAGIVASIR
jgi:hydroxymethylbilane synthase